MIEIMLQRLSIPVAFLLIILTDVASGQSTDLQNFKVAASGHHLWIIKQEKLGSDQQHLYHHTSEMGGAYLSPFMPLLEAPDRFFSWESRVWQMYSLPSKDRRDYRRDVYSVEAIWHEPTGEYRPSPLDHLKNQPSLPSVGRLIDVCGSGEGALALLIPEQHADVSISGRPGSPPDQPILESPQLLRLRGGKWNHIELPEGIPLSEGSSLCAVGLDGQGISILTPGDSFNRMATVSRRTAEGNWSRFDLDLGGQKIVEVLPVGNQIALIQEHDHNGDWIVSFIRQSGRLHIATLPDPHRHRAIASFDGRLRHFKLKKDGTLSWQHLDPFTGTMSEWEDFQVQSLSQRAIWQTVVFSGLVLLALFLALALKPQDSEPIRLPSDCSPLPIGLRGTGLLIDLAIGGFLVTLIFDVQFSDLLHHPLLGGTLESMFPYTAMALLTFAISLLGELLTRTTLGKAVLGGRVISSDGRQPTVKQILVRNLYKLALLFIPPIGVLMFRNPNLQGIPELKSNTMIVQEIEKPDET
ncbi:MAG: RDD family protein [Planctomycetota bacterium]|nr:RDD family protein [Planctomycetota bacterium]